MNWSNILIVSLFERQILCYSCHTFIHFIGPCGNCIIITITIHPQQHKSRQRSLRASFCSTLFTLHTLLKISIYYFRGLIVIVIYIRNSNVSSVSTNPYTAKPISATLCSLFLTGVSGGSSNLPLLETKHRMRPCHNMISYWPWELILRVRLNSVRSGIYGFFIHIFESPKGPHEMHCVEQTSNTNPLPTLTKWIKLNRA